MRETFTVILKWFLVKSALCSLYEFKGEVKDLGFPYWDPVKLMHSRFPKWMLTSEI